MARSKREEYEICKVRGHVSDYGITTGFQTTSFCKYCDTGYWTETVLHESNVPEELDSEDTEQVQ